MNREQHQQEARSYSALVEHEFPRKRYRDLSEALYTFSELGLLGDMEIKDEATAVRIWALVEKVRRDGFPKDLRM